MRILVCSLASPGFLFPAVGLALQLRARGHELAFVTGAWARSLLAGQDLELLAGGPGFRVRSWHDASTVTHQRLLLGAALDRWPADALLTSALALGPLLVGEARGLPTAVIGLSSPMWATERSEDCARHQELLAAYRAARGQSRLAAAHPPNPLLGDLYLHRGLSEGGAGPWPQQVRRVGPELWEPPADRGLLSWLDAAPQPPIYLHQARSFGRRGFWSVAREALADLPVVAPVARMDQARGPVPSGWWVRPHVPMLQVLPRAGCLVASGSTTTALGALSQGCPALLLPAGSEQFTLARELTQLGLAETLSVDDLSAQGLRAAVDAAQLRSQAAAAAAARYREGQTRAAVELIQDWLP